MRAARVKPAPEDWGVAETRHRDDRARTPAERADCCADRVRFVAEIPRSTRTPAHFRLCAHHADVLALAAPRARIFPVKS